FSRRSRARRRPTRESCREAPRRTPWGVIVLTRLTALPGRRSVALKATKGRAWRSKARKSLLRHSAGERRADARPLDLRQPGNAVRFRQRDAVRLRWPRRPRPPGVDPRVADAPGSRVERLQGAPGRQRPDGQRCALSLPRPPSPGGRDRARRRVVAPVFQLAARPPADGADRRP